MIRIENLSVSYQDTLALQSLSLNIKGPTITGILGPNGAGKSTLIKAMLGIIDHEGQTYLNEEPLNQQLARIAYVEQKAQIDYNFPIKVKECVSLGLYPTIKLFQRLKRVIGKSHSGSQSRRSGRICRAPDQPAVRWAVPAGSDCEMPSPESRLYLSG